MQTDPWPKGLSQAVAVISAEPEELEKKQFITFADSHDGLDYTKWAILQLSSGETIALVRHQDCPSPGTEVWVHEETTEPAKILHELLAELAFNPDRFTWKNPAIGFH